MKLLVFFALNFGLSRAKFGDGVGTALPWPDQMIWSQVNYQPDHGSAIIEQTLYYDYTNTRQRIDNIVINAGSLNAESNNVTQLWIDDDLYTIYWEYGNCSMVNMGFPLPNPQWFLNSNTTINNGNLWLFSPVYYQYFDCQWLAVNGSFAIFNYYVNNTNGYAFREETLNVCVCFSCLFVFLSF